jgi:DNA-directed RNA polymerase sigma subunit (sigma70/sigma32)
VELRPRSLEEPFRGDDGAGGSLVELFADPTAEEGYDTVERELDADALRHTPNGLGDRERAVLRGRYGFDGPPQTLQALGTELDLTAERVRQIQQHALETLRQAGSTVLSEAVARVVADVRDEDAGGVSAAEVVAAAGAGCLN